MRIAYLTSAPLPSSRANSVHIAHMCDAIVGLGHEVELHGRRSGAPVAQVQDSYGLEHRFPVHRLPLFPVPGGTFLCAEATARRLRRSGPFDLVWGRSWPALLRAKRTGHGSVLECHEPPPDRMATAGQRAIIRDAGFRGLVVPTRSLAEELTRRFPELRDRPVIVEPNGTVLPLTLAPTAIHAPPRVGYVGSLHPGKGVELLLRLAPTMSHVEFHVIGGEPRQVRRRRSHSSTNVVFHGALANRQARDACAHFDVALAPYQRRVSGGGRVDLAPWTSPLKVLEYLAQGRAVVASDLPVMRELLTDGTDCLLVDPEDVGAWREAVEGLLDDETLRARLGAAGRRLVEERYTWRRRARRILERVTATPS